VQPTARTIFWKDVRVEIGWAHTADASPGGSTLAAGDAVALLRDLRRDPAAMDTLRAVLGDELTGTRVARLSDDKVIEELGWRVEKRWVRVAVSEYKLRFPKGLIEVVSAPAAPPPPAAPRAAPPAAAPQKQTCCNPDCAAAFQNAADNGTPLVERGAAKCQ
jgi:hypothetical protein